MANTKNATVPATVNGSATRRWTSKRVVEVIQDRRSHGLPLNSSAVVADDEPLLGAARRLFGSWDAALEATGIDPESVRHPRMDQLPQGTWNRERVLVKIHEHAQAGHDLAAHRVQAIDSKLVAAAVQQFGSWRQAIREAGFDYDLVCRYRRWDGQRVLKRLRQLDREGADLSYRTAEAWDKGFLAMAVQHFGSWENALKEAGLQAERRTVRWTKSRILEAIRNGTTSNRADGLRKAAIRMFGSWPEAVRAAGRPKDGPAKVRCLARKIRHEQGLSLEDVGRRLGYSHRAVSMLELDQWQDPRVSVALRLADVLGKGVEDLFRLR